MQLLTRLHGSVYIWYMMMKETKQETMFTANDTTYRTFNVDVKGNTFTIMVVAGKYNYVNVTKKTNNPFGTCGTDFASFDEAYEHYKSPEMKTALLTVETLYSA